MKQPLIACWIVIGLVGWIGFGYQLVEHHRRRPEVRMWAESVYDTGYSDGGCGASSGASGINKRFSVDAVMLAYDGAWE